MTRKTPPRAPKLRIYAAFLVLSTAMTACSVTLNRVEGPRAPTKDRARREAIA